MDTFVFKIIDKELFAAFDHQDLDKDLKNSEFWADDFPS